MTAQAAKKRVLVLCTGNSCRSQMAEGLVRHDMGDEVEVFSAGLYPSRVHPLAVRAMAEVGIDISCHRSKPVADFKDQEFDLVITLCDHARDECPSFPGAAMQLHESIPDPYVFGTEEDDDIEKYREARDLIIKKILPLVRKSLGL